MGLPVEKQTYYSVVIGGVTHDVTGRKRTPKGYIALCIKTHPKSDKLQGYIFEHRVIMEMSLGRYLDDHEIVHHENEVKHDNRLSNLSLMSKGEHTILHHLGRKQTDIARQKMSEHAKKRFGNKENHPSYININCSELIDLVNEFGPTIAAEKLGVSRRTIYNKLEDIKCREGELI